MRQDVIPAMGEISKCLLIHGFIVVLIVHPIYEIIEVLSRSGDNDYVDIPLVPIRGFRRLKARIQLRDNSGLVFFPVGGLRWLRVRIQAEHNSVLISFPLWHLPNREASHIRFELGSPEVTKLPPMAVVLTGCCLAVAALIEAAVYTVMAVFRASLTTFAMAIRAIPLLLAILLVVFSSSDAWRIYGSEAYVRFTVITFILVALGIVAVNRIVSDEAEKIVESKSGRSDWTAVGKRSGCKPIILEIIEEYSREPDLVDQRATVLTKSNVTPFTMTGQLTKSGRRWRHWLMTNAQLLLRFTTVMQVIAVALWVSGSFIALGIVVISSGAYQDLLPAKTRPSIIEKFHILGQTFIVSQQLVLLSVTLGTIAGLTFATLSLQDEGSRDRFFKHSVSDLKCSLATLAYYLGAVQELILILRPDQSKIGKQLGLDIARFWAFDNTTLQQASKAIILPSERTKKILLDLLSAATKNVADEQHLVESKVRAALFYKAGEVLRIIPGVAWHMGNPAELEIEIGIGEGSAGKAFQTGQPNLAIYHRARSDTSISDRQQRSRVDPDLKWIISIPVLGPGNEVIGVLNVDGVTTERTPEQLEKSIGDVIHWAQLSGYVLGLDSKDSDKADETG